MVDLAGHYNQGPVPLRDIAARQDISEKYLEQIIMQLNRAGLVKSTRGAQGGYTLAREPQSITVGNILRVLEGSLAPVECLSTNSKPCQHADTCVTLNVWKRLMVAIEDVVDSVSLADLIAESAGNQAFPF